MQFPFSFSICLFVKVSPMKTMCEILLGYEVLVGMKAKYLTIPFITAGITWIIWYKQEDIQKDILIKESISNKIDDLVKLNDLNTECRVPKKDNPFMNPTLFDYNSNKPQGLKACPSYNNVGVQRIVEELFNEDLYRDTNDIFSKNNSQRQFYTVPGNQVPNDQGSFAQWLYGTPPTCKEGNKLSCLSDMGNSGYAGPSN